MSTLCRRLLFLCLFLVLSGCVSTPPRPSNPLAQIDPRNGIVAMQIEGNVLVVYTGGNYAVTVHLKEVGSDRVFSLPCIGGQRPLLVGQLPPGAYYLTSIHHFGGIVTLDANKVTGAASRFAFHVKAGSRTDLGVLFLHQPREVVNTTRLYSRRFPANPDYAAALRHYAPTLAGVAGESLSWDHSLKLEPVVDVRADAYPVGNGFEDASGSYWIGGDTGQAFKRNVDGQWSRLDTGSLSQVLSVRPLAGGHLIAGFSDGMVRIGRENGDWQVVPLPSDDDVLNVGQLSDGRIVALATTPRKRAILYYLDGVNDRDWKTLHTIPLTGTYVYFAKFFPDSIEVVVNTDPARVSSVIHLHAYDLASKAWSVRPAQYLFYGVREGVDGKTRCTQDELSVDGGTTWHPARTPGGRLACRDANVLYTLKLNNFFSEKDGYALHTSRDGGATWKVTSPKLPLKYSMAYIWAVHSNGVLANMVEPLRRSNLLILRTPEGPIYSTTNDGATWTKERS